jgi:hypothetical protein
MLVILHEQKLTSANSILQLLINYSGKKYRKTGKTLLSKMNDIKAPNFEIILISYRAIS